MSSGTYNKPFLYSLVSQCQGQASYGICFADHGQPLPAHYNLVYRQLLKHAISLGDRDEAIRTRISHHFMRAGSAPLYSEEQQEGRKSKGEYVWTLPSSPIIPNIPLFHHVNLRLDLVFC